VLAACYPVLTVTAIVLTGNNYFHDAVGGFAALGIGYGAAVLIERLHHRRVDVVDLTEPAVPPESPAERERRAGTG
jgi:hypothetical protein